jgi:bifunctional UDP-N-acetylglucosamine pyrophosphorylase/glucosamine-1-phosphate N-acetyltransferase
MMMVETESDKLPIPGHVRRLIEKGITIPNPFSVEIGEEVDPKRISNHGVVLYSGAKLHGAKTLIASGAKLGFESPAAIVDCWLGSEVELKGGYFKSSVFLEKSNMACGAHVREGCLIEEEANAGHTVGLKQTVLFPFVTLGSLINFCDCLMAGGTSRKNHSEVGSSYIHFNYTPNPDKATPSLIGDVPRGVMLNQPPIFLGGQGGLVGPSRLGYGTVTAAGTVYRGDSPEGGKLLVGEGGKLREKIFHLGLYEDIRRKVYNNINYIANILALRQWYMYVRSLFCERHEFGQQLHEGAMEVLRLAIDERLTRFRALAQQMERSVIIGEKILKGRQGKNLLKRQRELLENWPAAEACLTGAGEEQIGLTDRGLFIQNIQAVMAKGGNYIECIQALDGRASATGTRWLQNIIDEVVNKTLDLLPSFRG